LDNHNIVLLGPTGYSTTGEVFNLLAEEVATRTAIHLKADKLIFLGKQHGLLNEQGSIANSISPHKLDAQIEKYQDSNPDIACIYAVPKSLDAWRTSRPSDFLCL
jgi:amino-acid N-acetyltransferase